ncbi:DUF1127 domain-containing protein [Bosea sp. (in: a-proteobacteria)]|uniref:DUF1127 domain-containing protein n=1 Tax=Bosea sp. (in: a-proteobacteria) TaxID=1871050 RepID=UPI002FC72407
MISFIIGPARHVLAAGGPFGRFLGGIGRWLQARRDYHRLCDMSERDLRDLGLRDSNLRDTTAAPFFGDPTGIIALHVEERRGLAGGGKRRRDPARPGFRGAAPVRAGC